MTRRLAWGVVVGLVSCGDDDTQGTTEATSGGGTAQTNTSADSTSIASTSIDSTAVGSVSVDSTDTAVDSTNTGVTSGTTTTGETTADATESSSSDGVPGEDCVIHVTSTGADAASGLTWMSAKRTVPAALELAASYDCSIWIAEGEYLPTGDDDPAVSFVLFDDARVYGGFAGDEATLEERDIPGHPTVLSGDLGLPGDAADNAFHVVVGADGALLDGLIVSGGDAREELAGQYGAGLVLTSGSMVLRHCTFEGNGTGRGSAIGNIGGSGGDGAAIHVGIGADALTVEDCTFMDNRTGHGSEGNAIGGNGGRGASIYFAGGELSVVDSVFAGNTSGTGGVGGDIGGFGGDGAAVHFAGEVLLVTTSTFTNNTTGDGGPGGDVGGGGGSGAAISIAGGHARIDGCELAGNVAGDGGDAPLAGAGSQVGGNGGLGGAISAVAHEGVIVVGTALEDNVTGTGGVGHELDGGAGLGGAIFLRGAVGDVLVAHSTFVGNRSGLGAIDVGGGGAIAVMPSSAGMPQGATRIVGSVFAANEGEVGGALWIRNNGLAPIDIVSSSFALDVAETGGAVWYQSLSPEGTADATLVDSILWGDAAGVSPEIQTSAGFIGDPVVALAISSSIVDGGCDDTALAITCGPGILTEDPQYADALTGDLHPLGAAAIDAGDVTALPADSLDLDGDGDVAEPWPQDLDASARVVGSSVDLGPYESS